MGNNLTNIFSNLFSTKKEVRILTLGLDGAGKTTFLYKLRLNENVITIPTIGFNVENIKFKNLNFTIWDIGGQDKIRPLWRHYFYGTNAIIFIVDSADLERIDEASEELHKLINEAELSNVPILIYANKQDLPKALSTAEITSRLSMNNQMNSQMNSIKNRKWVVQPSSIPNGVGLYEGLDWLSKAISSSSSSSN